MKSFFTIMLLAVAFPLCINTALAETEKKGWKGSIGIVAGSVRGHGNLNAYGGKKRIHSLDATPARNNYDFIFPTGQVSYTFQNNITLYMDGGLLSGGDAGIRYTFADKTRLSVFSPLILGTRGEVWQDPYLTGKNRKTTDTKLERAIGFSIDNIWGSHASIEYIYQNQSIKNDRAGNSLTARLTSKQINQLQRDNKSHYLATSLPPLELGHNLYLIGGASYTRAVAKGRANRFTGYQLDLTLMYEKGNLEVFGHLLTGKNNYRSTNPVFDVKRADDLGSVAVGMTYWKPFDWKDVSLSFLVARERKSSNINFYDMQNDTIATTIRYHY